MNPFAHIFAPLNKALDEAEARSRELRDALLDDMDEVREEEIPADFAEDLLGEDVA